MGKMDVRMQRRGSSDAARPDMHRSRCLKLAVFTSTSDQYPIFVQIISGNFNIPCILTFVKAKNRQ